MAERAAFGPTDRAPTDLFEVEGVPIRLNRPPRPTLATLEADYRAFCTALRMGAERMAPHLSDDGRDALADALKAARRAAGWPILDALDVDG